MAGWWTLTGRLAGDGLWHVLSTALAAFCFIAFAQVYNDIRDADLDAVSKPGRPLPAGLVSLRSARSLAALLAAGSLAAASATGFSAFLLCAGCLLLAVCYSVRLKNTVLVGNSAVALVSSCAYVLPAAAVGRITPVLLLGQALIFFFILGNELYKTVADAEADAQYGLRTVATARGPRTVVIVLAGCWAVLSGILVTCALAGAEAFAAVGAVAILLPAGCGVVASHGAVRDAHAPADAGHRWWLLAWALGLPALVLLR